MSFLDYVCAKLVTLCFLGIAALLMGACMAFAGVSLAEVGFFSGFFFFLTVGWLAAGFFWERSRLLRLDQLIEALPEKYLLAEVLPRPVNPIEKYYYQAMRTVSRSSIEVAEAAKREKEEYFDYVESWVHEMKTPLTACSLILDNGGNSRKLRTELKRADNLTEVILYYARLRTAERDTRIQKFLAADVIEEAVKSQMELFIASKVQIQTDVQEGFILYTDRKSVCFALKQLLLNSAKYSPGCRIRVCAGEGRIAVEDNGIGILDYEVHRVTERGFTGSNGNRHGTGMGLYIVKELCDRLAIGLQIESQEGVFTRITLHFQS